VAQAQTLLSNNNTFQGKVPEAEGIVLLFHRDWPPGYRWCSAALRNASMEEPTPAGTSLESSTVGARACRREPRTPRSGEPRRAGSTPAPDRMQRRDGKVKICISSFDCVIIRPLPGS
jgi:hypothetical protein